MFHLLDKEHEPLEHRADELIIRATGEGISRGYCRPASSDLSWCAGCTDMVMQLIHSPAFQGDLLRLFAAEGDDGRSNPYCVLFAALDFGPTHFFDDLLTQHRKSHPVHTEVIGMHIRSAPRHVGAYSVLSRQDEERFFDCARILSESEPPPGFFISADSVEVRLRAHEELGSQARMVHSGEIVHSGAHKGQQGQDAQGQPILPRDLIMAYIEWWLLGEADALMLTVSDWYTSTYGLTASWRRCTPKLLPIPLYNCSVIRHPTLCVSETCECEPWLALLLGKATNKRNPARAACLVAN